MKLQQTGLLHSPNQARVQEIPRRSANILIVITLVLQLASIGDQLARAKGYTVSFLAEAVNVHKLSVPDLVVIDQQNQPHFQPAVVQSKLYSPDQTNYRGGFNTSLNNQPEAQSLINSNQDLTSSDLQSQITFQCLISYDKRKDRNLIIKWHHDDRAETIYQWIPELHKRSIAPQYRAYIVPIVSTPVDWQISNGFNLSSPGVSSPTNQTQLLEAGFRLIRPSKELGGKYECSAISAQNEDSKWKKMIVYTPPRVFRFNASRTDIGAQLVSQRDRLIQLSQPATIFGPTPPTTSNNQLLPLAYRNRGSLDPIHGSNPTTISPQMYSTIDYVNVNQQTHIRQSQSNYPWFPQASNSPTRGPYGVPSHLADSFKQQSASNKLNKQHQQGVKLVCDIDQVFPVPEVSIYRLAKLDGSHPDKLAKLDTKIERNSTTGLYHVQVTSVLEDDELQMKYGLNEPVYFECLIALTNLELSKYADNKRSLLYRPGLLTSSTNHQPGMHTSEDVNPDQSSASLRSQAGYIHPVLELSLALILSMLGRMRRDLHL